SATATIVDSPTNINFRISTTSGEPESQNYSWPFTTTPGSITERRMPDQYPDIGYVSLDRGRSHADGTRWARSCRSRIRCQAATGSWTRSVQWKTQRTWFRSAEATGALSANVSGVRPPNEAWQRIPL